VKLGPPSPVYSPNMKTRHSKAKIKRVRTNPAVSDPSLAELDVDGGRARLTSSGLDLKPHYEATDLKKLDTTVLFSRPGQAPYIRGAYPGMFRTKPWRIFQLSGFGNPEDEGERIRFLLAHGETGFIMEHDRNIADHLYDLDHHEVTARHEDVGLVGAVIFSARDFDTALQGIDLDKVYVHPGGAVIQHAPFALACYWTVAQRRGLALRSLSGTGQADFFLTYVGCINKQQVPVQAGLRFNADTIEFCLEHLPHWVPVSIAGYNGAESGLNAYQELAAVFANAVEYIDAVVQRGRYSVAEVSRAVAGVSFRVSMDLFEDIAKLRAARQMWSELLRTRYGLSDGMGARLRIHSLTAGSAMTYQQPLNNLVRGTIMALSGVLGGTQSLGVSGYDEAISIPSQHAHQMSVRIQQILQHETRLTDVADPLGGSYFVESLTAELQAKAWEFFRRIEDNGGFLASIDSGWLQKCAQENQLRESAQIETHDRMIVGVNFADEDVSGFRIDGFEGKTDAWERGLARLVDLRRGRESRRLAECLRDLRAACIGDANILPAMMAAVDADATIGEIGEIFRDVFGDWGIPFTA
jgi:methylmalonyl-CoA mutase N-terminal domain/subunit